MSKVALITGITGMDGSHLAEELITNGYQVYGMVRRSARGTLGALDHPSMSKTILDKVNLVSGDICDTHSIRTILENCPTFTHVFHLAAQSFVAESHRSPITTNEINFIGTMNLFSSIISHYEEAGEPVPKIYFAGTSEMFSGRPEACNENTPYEPQSPYAISKVASAHYCHYLRKRGFPLYIGVLYNHESSRRGHEFVTRKIIHNLCLVKAFQQKSFGIGNMEAQRDWTDARDMVRGMRLILESPTPDDFVLASGQTRSVRAFLEAACKALKLPEPYDQYVYVDPQFLRPTEVWTLIGDASKAREQLGWKPEISFEQMVDDMVRWEWDLVSRK